VCVCVSERARVCTVFRHGTRLSLERRQFLLRLQLLHTESWGPKHDTWVCCVC